MKGTPFSCLGSGIPKEHRPNIINMDQKQSSIDNNDDNDNDNIEHKSVPPTPRNSIILPSLASASRSLLNSRIELFDTESLDTSFLNRDYQFVFRSKKIESCKYKPYKTILFIASAQGFESNDEDPRLSPNGVSQCKIVSAALRKAKQKQPNIMYVSTMYRALSTMQLVCPDWYDDVKSIALDQLRPKIGKLHSNKRSNLHLLQQDFKKVSFNHVKSDKDILWKHDKFENDDDLSLRIHKFITKFLIPQSELLRTQYGTLQTSSFANIGWNPSSASSSQSSLSPNKIIKEINNKRIVVISHREFLSYLMKNVVIDISPQLCKEWKHCDLRKVFVYTKQQLGINDIPCYALQNGQYYSPNNNQHKQRFSRKNRNNKSPRSKTPNITKRTHKKSSSMIKLNNNKNDNNNSITTTSSGDILMTNKLFQHHSFTLTTMSAALCNHNYNHNNYNNNNNNIKPLPIIPLKTTKSADNVSNVIIKRQHNNNNTISSTDDDDDDDDDDEDNNNLPNKSPVTNHSRSVENQQQENLPMRGLVKTYSAKVSSKPKQHIIIVTPPSNTKIKTNTTIITKFSNIDTTKPNGQ